MVIDWPTSPVFVNQFCPPRMLSRILDAGLNPWLIGLQRVSSRPVSNLCLASNEAKYLDLPAQF